MTGAGIDEGGVAAPADDEMLIAMSAPQRAERPIIEAVYRVRAVSPKGPDLRHSDLGLGGAVIWLRPDQDLPGEPGPVAARILQLSARIGVL